MHHRRSCRTGLLPRIALPRDGGWLRSDRVCRLAAGSGMASQQPAARPEREQHKPHCCGGDEPAHGASVRRSQRRRQGPPQTRRGGRLRLHVRLQAAGSYGRLQQWALARAQAWARRRNRLGAGSIWFRSSETVGRVPGSGLRHRQQGIARVPRERARRQRGRPQGLLSAGRVWVSASTMVAPSARMSPARSIPAASRAAPNRIARQLQLIIDDQKVGRLQLALHQVLTV